MSRSVTRARGLVAGLTALALAIFACGRADDSESPVGPDIDAPAGGSNEEEDRLPPPVITLTGSIASYRGAIAQEYARDFLDRVSGHGTGIDTLVINSSGGETVGGMDVGEWVHENGVVVVVDTVCFSSCANYIFTAAPSKSIRENAFVGWHGSEQQNRFFDEKFANENPRNPAGACRKTPLTVDADPNRRQSSGYDRELKFLEKIGLKVDAMVWGLAQYERCVAYMNMDVDGWTFDLPSMGRLGIGNVTYEGPGEYPSRTVVEQGGIAVYKVSESDLK